VLKGMGRAINKTVRPHRYFSPRHRLPFHSRNKDEIALDDVASNIYYCSPRHRLPFYSRNKGENALENVASNTTS